MLFKIWYCFTISYIYKHRRQSCHNHQNEQHQIIAYYLGADPIVSFEMFEILVKIKGKGRVEEKEAEIDMFWLTTRGT